MKRAVIIAAVALCMSIFVAPVAHAATLWKSSGGVGPFMDSSNVPDSLLKAIAKDSDPSTAQAWKDAYAKAWNAHVRAAARDQVRHPVEKAAKTTNMLAPAYKAAFVKEVGAGVIKLTSSKKGNYVLTDTNSDATTVILFQFP